MFTLEGVHVAQDHAYDDACIVYLTFVDDVGMPTNRSTAGTYTRQCARSIQLDVAEMVGRRFTTIPEGIESARFSSNVWAALSCALA